MYQNFDDWDTATRSAQRIYDPFAYRPVIFERMVPIALGEAPRQAERCPVLWRRDDHGDPELVVLRGLPAEAEISDARTQSRTSLPLLLQAYPFRFADPHRPGDIGLDRCAPMRERDAGSYIVDHAGELLPGAELKIQALQTWAAGWATRQTVTETVFREGQVERVTLPGDLSERFGLPDLFTVTAQPDDQVIFGSLPREDWLTVARFLAAQRLSLYTMARLITVAGIPL